MVKNFLFLAATSFIITGCKQKKTLPVKHEPDNNNSSFFPVTQYLLGQIKDLDTLPLSPLKITTVDGRADSVWIKREEIRSFIEPFINPVIDSIRYNSYFSQSSFLDQTINTYTFSYDPVRKLPDSMEVKRWDIYVDPGTDKVSRIYIVKQLNTAPSPKTIQLIWKSGYYCQVTTIAEKKGEPPKIKEEKLIWNFND